MKQILMYKSTTLELLSDYKPNYLECKQEKTELI